MQNNINNLTIKIIVNNTIVYEINKQIFLNESQEIQSKIIQDKLILPNWIDNETFSFFVKYIKNKQLDQYKQKLDDANFLIQTIRISDYLTMIKFQERFIIEILTPCINIKNCVIFLQQTHRKLKIQETGSQSWYSLLNACITFLAINLNEIYSSSAQKIKKLHQKILNEILDRAIRNGNLNQKMIFQLIMQSKKINTVEILCQNLRQSIMNKRINPKIHAKLSWKLQDLLSIKDKKTKKFKFLDFDWLLQASRNNTTNQLKIKLIYCGTQNKCQLGAFYAKVVWWVQGQSNDKIQQKIRLNYILMNKKHEIIILILSEQKQVQLGSNKIQLSIFCCMDQIYTFILNYIANNPHEIKKQNKYLQYNNNIINSNHSNNNGINNNKEEKCKLNAEELYSIIQYLKEKQLYSSSINFLQILQEIKADIPGQLLQDYPYNQLTSLQIDFLDKYNKKPSQRLGSTYINNPVLSQNSDGRSNASQSRRSEERPQSRGRLRKIFASSPNNKEIDLNNIKLEDINRISNVKNYFYDKNHPFYGQL